ncbi:uncharacterized protein LOC110848680 [Folsomia candida]|uniref:CUB domain-containing protein n=1 Tax=Folsomia candida TaxID=158441 RepID=A0A226EDP8_FOLCA|nr:uncharacterized protein LOC110848680 [Folsomia candida]OXA55264.1 hypothetical protein Fcan01_08823 [Folsomia candida]
MKSFALILVFCLVLNCSVFVSHAKFYLPEPNQKEITSRGWNYSEFEGIDVIWRFRHSIQLEINELQMDGQSGDFLLISDLPLTFEDYFDEYSGTDDMPTDLLPHSIVTSQGLLLSWELQPGSKFQILSKYGTFVYFHAEGSVPSRGSFEYKGFNITVTNLDEARLPPSTTTTEGTKAPPAPDVEIYTSKFLLYPPFQFKDKKEAFKEAIAEIGTEYCTADPACGDLLTENFTSSDVNIPTDRGLHMCDISWDTFENCVEVTFAITREEDVGGYIMPKWRLDDMWVKFGHRLVDFGFTPYDNHPKSLKNMDTWIWMASFLGIMLFLMIPMCLFCIIHEVSTTKHVPSNVDPDEMEKKETETLTKNPWRDLSNPIRPILAKLKRQSEDNKYLEVSNSDTNSNNMSDPPPYKSPKTKSNVLFQEQNVAFEYDNRGYHEDSGIDGDESVPYGFNFNNGNNRDFMDIADEDEFPEEDRFLRIERHARFGENSDTEI